MGTKEKPMKSIDSLRRSEIRSRRLFARRKRIPWAAIAAFLTALGAFFVLVHDVLGLWAK